MINLGTIANPNIDLDTFTGDDNAIMNLNNQEVSFHVTRDEDGSIWVIIGSDSSLMVRPTLIRFCRN